MRQFMFLATACVAFISSAASAQTVVRSTEERLGWLPPSISSDFVIVSNHIDNVRQARTIFDGAAECRDSAVCMNLVRAAGTYFQVPLDKVVATAALLSVERQGEGTYMNFTLPDGYAYCRANMTMTSIVPHDGPRGSLFLGAARPSGMYAETWTPVSPWHDPTRSWVQADISILGVRQNLAAREYASGRCHDPGAGRVLFYCRGGGCVNTADNGQSLDSSSPPGANSRK